MFSKQQSWRWLPALSIVQTVIFFLTGKAGTGKTTFLKQLASETYKSYLIVAPTGIAALNAEGVTIHSQFLLPFGSFIPEREPSGKFTETTHILHKTYAHPDTHPEQYAKKGAAGHRIADYR